MSRKKTLPECPIPPNTVTGKLARFLMEEGYDIRPHSDWAVYMSKLHDTRDMGMAKGERWRLSHLVWFGYSPKRGWRIMTNRTTAHNNETAGANVNWQKSDRAVRYLLAEPAQIRAVRLSVRRAPWIEDPKRAAYETDHCAGCADPADAIEGVLCRSCRETFETTTL